MRPDPDGSTGARPRRRRRSRRRSRAVRTVCANPRAATASRAGAHQREQVGAAATRLRSVADRVPPGRDEGRRCDDEIVAVGEIAEAIDAAIVGQRRHAGIGVRTLQRHEPGARGGRRHAGPASAAAAGRSPTTGSPASSVTVPVIAPYFHMRIDDVGGACAGVSSTAWAVPPGRRRPDAALGVAALGGVTKKLPGGRSRNTNRPSPLVRIAARP